jgi:hypothetical protein
MEDYSGGQAKLSTKTRKKTNMQTKVPPILLMARIIAKKNMREERERERERERSVCVCISIYEGRLSVCFVCQKY